MEVTLSNALEDVDENEDEDDNVDGDDAEEAFVSLEESEECTEFVFGWRPRHDTICPKKTWLKFACYEVIDIIDLLWLFIQSEHAKKMNYQKEKN